MRAYILTAALAVTLYSTAAFAGPGDRSGWVHEVGTRYWRSSGSLGYDVEKPKISRLDYETETNGAEVYGTFIRKNDGLTVKLMAGLGQHESGSLRDRDFITTQAASDSILGGGVPIATVNGFSYSDTDSDVKESNIQYFMADVGAPIWMAGDDSLAVIGFGGIGYIDDRMVAHGIRCNPTQVDTILGSGGTCGAAGSTQYSFDGKVIANEAQWTMLRLGVAPRLYLGSGFRLEGEAALVPYAWFKNEDSHYLRTDLGTGVPNFVDEGSAWGGQGEVMLTYSPIEELSLGVGGRYWILNSDETDTEVGNPVQLSTGKVHNWEYRRGGVLAQARYQF